MTTNQLQSSELEVKVAPVSRYNEVLQERLAQEVSEQSKRLDDLARQLIALNIAVPGLYASLLRYMSGSDATVEDPLLLVFIFLPWLLALGFAFVSLFPLNYQVDPDSPNDIEGYFSKTAKRKLVWLAFAGFFSFVGISFSVFSLFK